MRWLINLVFSLMLFASFCGIVAEQNQYKTKWYVWTFGICAAFMLIYNIYGG